MERNSFEDDFELIESEATATSPVTSVTSQVIATEERPLDRCFEAFVTAMQSSSEVVSKTGPIFHLGLSTGDHDLIYSTFIEAIPEEYRGIFKCSCCREFCRHFGDLCVVGADGSVQPLFWSGEAEIPGFYKKAVTKVREIFEGKAVGNEFRLYSEADRDLGRSKSGGWTHMSAKLTNVPCLAHSGSQDTTTSYEMLDRIIADYSPETVARAHHILHENLLPYAESHKSTISYLQEVVKSLDGKDYQPVYRRNLITNYACKAFVGCLSSLRGGMVGTLLTSLEDGEDFETLRMKWELRANPLAYLRPTAQPPEGNIKDAEKIFAGLGYTPNDLARVYLTHDQIPESAILWSPSNDKEEQTPTGSMPLFGHLLEKSKSLKITDDDNIPPKDISFRNFALHTLPTAVSIEVFIHPFVQPYFFTNGRPGSKPLMSHMSDTNTASWYTWDHAKPCAAANLSSSWTPVLSITTFPHMWEHLLPIAALSSHSVIETFKFSRHGIRYMFVLAGIKDKSDDKDLGLFPTLMNNEFHAVRKTVEAFSNAGEIDQPEGGKAYVGGLVVENPGWREEGLLVRVMGKNGQVTKYRICIFE